MKIISACIAIACLAVVSCGDDSHPTAPLLIDDETILSLHESFPIGIGYRYIKPRLPSLGPLESGWQVEGILNPTYAKLEAVLFGKFVEIRFFFQSGHLFRIGYWVPGLSGEETAELETTMDDYYGELAWGGDEQPDLEDDWRFYLKLKAYQPGESSWVLGWSLVSSAVLEAWFGGSSLEPGPNSPLQPSPADGE